MERTVSDYETFLAELGEADPTCIIIGVVHDEIEVECDPKKREAVIAVLRKWNPER